LKNRIRPAAVGVLTASFLVVASTLPSAATSNERDDAGGELTLTTRLGEVAPVWDLEEIEYINSVQTKLRDVDGFGTIRVDEADRSVTVTFKGEAPAELTGLVDAAPTDLRVDVEAARYSARELQDALEAVIAAPSAQESLTGVYTTDEAVVVEVDPGSAASKSARTFESRLESEIAAVGASVPVEIVPSPQKVPASRFGHGGPWVGGALYQTNDSGGACSTGFAGTSTVNSSLQGIITAHHCTVDQPASYTYKHFTRDLGKRIYHHTPGPPQHQGFNTIADASFIETPDGSVGAVYIGGVSDPDGLAIMGTYASPPQGQSICYSGAFSAGVTCGHNVVHTNYFWRPYSGANFLYGPQFRTRHITGNATIGQGDSGGPAFVAVNYDGHIVGVAAGIISGIDQGDDATNLACVGLLPPGRLCSDVAMAQSFYTAYSAMPIQVKTWTGGSVR